MEKAKSFWENRLAGLLEVLMAQNGDYNTIFFARKKSSTPQLVVGVERDQKGFIRTPAGTALSPDSQAAANVIAVHRSGKVHFSPIRHLSTGKVGKTELYAGTPVYNRQNDLVGVILIEIAFDRLVNNTLKGEIHNQILLFDHEGVPLAPTLSSSSSESFRQIQQSIDPLSFPALLAQINEKPKRLLLDLPDEKIGLVLGRFVYDPPSSERLFFIGASSSLTPFDATSELLRNNLFTRMLGIALTITLLSALLISRLTRPIRQLTEAAKKISDGGEKVNLHFPGNDEVAELAESLNTMMQRLETRTEQLNATYKELLHTEKLGAIGMLSASIAHEFGSPVFGLRNLLEGMKVEDGNLVDRQLIDLAIDECNRLKDLIVNLRDFSNPTDGNMESVDLRRLIEQVLSLYSKQFEQRNISIEKEYGISLPSIKAIPDQIKQVILNLLSNAEIAIPEEEEGHIVIRTFLRHDHACFSVKDNGAGIRPENLEKIFRPFYTTRKSRQGLGLGLSISHSIIERHGGRIEVQSIPGKGTTFTVEMPVERRSTC